MRLLRSHGHRGCRRVRRGEENSMSRLCALDESEIGRQLGHDLFFHRKVVDRAALSIHVREGFDEAVARGKREPAVPDRFVKKWLQLRLRAFERGRVFDVKITPDLLRSIDVPVCPVLRIELTHGRQLPSDWSIDRLNNDGAYAPNNLAVMSTQANRAKGARPFDEVLSLASLPCPTDGLEPAEWMRLAVLMLGPCFASNPKAAPVLPLVAPMPMLSLRLAMQQVQHVFTARAGRTSGRNELVRQFRCTSSTANAQRLLTALAESVHRGLKRTPTASDVWLEPEVMTTLQQWRASLNDRQWALAGEISRRLCGSRRLGPLALGSLHLGSQGYRA
jgi:hypothetical protein